MNLTGKLMLRIVKAIDNKCSKQMLIKDFRNLSGLVHSVKLNSVYHVFGLDALSYLSNKYKIPLFLDLKLYDTPLTIGSYVETFVEDVAYLTVTYAYGNANSLSAAFEATEGTKLKLYIVAALTSVGGSAGFYKDMFDLVASLNLIYNTNHGVVVPLQYIRDAKKYGLDTLTPGLVLDKKDLIGYKEQKQVGTVEEAFLLGGDAFVLGRHFPKTKDKLVKLNEVLNM